MWRNMQVSPTAKKILVVDDEPIIADTIVAILLRHGFEATAAYSGSEAIERAGEFCPDSVLSDVLMPGIDGVQTAMSLREMCPSIRVLLFSGQAAISDLLQEARARGLRFELLAKPIHPDELLKILTKVE